MYVENRLGFGKKKKERESERSVSLPESRYLELQELIRGKEEVKGKER